MSRNQITAAQFRNLADAAMPPKQRVLPVTPAGLKRLQRNAADPAGARRRKASVGRESDVQAACEDYLRAEGLVSIPINSGAATIIGGRACLKGVPDLVTWIPAGRVFVAPLTNQYHYTAAWAVICFVECKRPKGGQYSREQIVFRERALADGCIWVGATCVEDVMAVIPPRGRR